jgi:hypothetical protein
MASAVYDTDSDLGDSKEDEDWEDKVYEKFNFDKIKYSNVIDSD